MNTLIEFIVLLAYMLRLFVWGAILFGLAWVLFQAMSGVVTDLIEIRRRNILRRLRS